MAAESDIEQCPNKEAARQRNSVMLNQPEKDVLQESSLGKAINNVKNNAPKLLA